MRALLLMALLVSEEAGGGPVHPLQQQAPGLEGRPPLGNLMLLARAHRSSSGGQAWSKHDEGATPRGNMNLASDGRTTCVSTPSDSRCTGE